MTTMRAVRFSTYGPPSVLRVMDIAKPVLQPCEVLVEVAASAINPSDVKFVSGVLTPTLPRTPGRDYAGTVVAGSDRWSGKSVWGNGAGFGVTRDGSHAQFVAVPEAWLSEMPGNLSLEQAAAVGVPFVTAWSALVVAGEIRSGDTVLITGASGAVGRAATQIAHWKNARVIRAGRNDDSQSSTDPFINTRTMNLPAMVAALTGNKGVSLVLDTVGGPLFEPALKSMGIPRSLRRDHERWHASRRVRPCGFLPQPSASDRGGHRKTDGRRDRRDPQRASSRLRKQRVETVASEDLATQ